MIFIFTALIATALIIQCTIDWQLSDDEVINKTGKRRTLNQLITKKSSYN